MRKKWILSVGLLASLLLWACQRDSSVPDGQPEDPVQIRVGGVSTSVLATEVTKTDPDPIDEETLQRADAETIPWLRSTLFHGLDITYGKADRTNSRVAVLTLIADNTQEDGIKRSDAGLAEYSFFYRRDDNGDKTTDPAIWYDNGAHFFEGLHVPERITSGNAGFPADLTTDQHDDAAGDTEASLGNYTLLSHYLGMPSNYTVNATVARIKLPFRHRLARVLAYILIDPSLGDATISGYSLDANGKDNPTTSQIRFCNVDVLEYVNDSYNSTTQHHTYTPKWKKVRKAIPHFVGERGSYDDANNVIVGNETDHFIAYYDIHKKEYIYPADALWTTLHGKTYNETTQISSDGAYQRTVYGKVPVYDMIVRPTYTTLNNVMFDEEGVSNPTTKQNLYVATNQIEFEITLSNGLIYSKRFTFDLDANYETVVYLHINRERVDYNSSGSQLWVETKGDDDYYGVNNLNGNTLSIAGSGWQRAYTNDNTNYGVTDGHPYLHDSDDEYAQYVTDARWIEMFREAHVGGRHHGDYFILKNNISIPAAALPDDFVFTGHLDGLDHTITLTNASYTEVTQRAYDSYETYTNESGTEPKYIQLSDGSYQLVPGGAEYYTYEGNTYTLIVNLGAYAEASAYAKTGETTYVLVNFYKKVHHAQVTQVLPAKDPSFLFAGLNGNYLTAQEVNMNASWEANVHMERVGSTNYWVPYRCDTDGWRAEVINTNVSGAAMFSSSAVITGYVHNCWEESINPVTDYTPSLPVY